MAPVGRQKDELCLEHFMWRCWGPGAAFCSSEWLGWSMGAVLWAPESAGETGRVGEDRGGSARAEKASGSQRQRKSQRKWGHGNPGVMDVRSGILPEMKRWL